MVSYPLPPRNFGQPDLGSRLVRFSLEAGDAGCPDRDEVASVDRAGNREGPATLPILKVQRDGREPQPVASGRGMILAFPRPRQARRWKW